ncbi:Gfo/Idh/MocA family oxidoreductase [Belnapia sp. T6]|uniref:Gfo/Idh/MocA family oxidoreductase n=1 Tax=Belnapia mucosa TaxID=2804532 RepID=A0ABS1V0V7_9PROT|nr:Gfo/Idh/MocA family oxidoreductase [Belnapia mucosa]MBL6453923.1 Gfo/Idh/MocA family oxidoreductase [Belnapia mucosa]
MPPIPSTRRGLVLAAAALGTTGAGAPGYPPPSPIDSGNVEGGRIRFPDWRAPADPPSGALPQPLPPGERVGFAVIGLGRIALEEVLPAFAQCKTARPVALVSGSPEKARLVAAQYGIRPEAVHGYAEMERLRDDPAVQAVYIALPNGMHREYTERAAAIGKHVLCEKPMATSAEDARAMVAACAKAQRWLMIAYRSQYEPTNRAVIALVRSGELGKLRFIEATNTQANGPGPQWRYSRQLAGGGALPDIGLYCLNAARYVTGEEPVELTATTLSPEGDERYREVEESVAFQLRFPSGVLARCLSSYGAYQDRMLRLQFERGAVTMPHAFDYQGQRLVVQRRVGDVPGEEERIIRPRNQFAQEIDHFAGCVRENRRPHTPGEEGLQDQVLMEAIYRAAAEQRPQHLRPPAEATRGPEPQQG